MLQYILRHVHVVHAHLNKNSTCVVYTRLYPSYDGRNVQQATAHKHHCSTFPLLDPLPPAFSLQGCMKHCCLQKAMISAVGYRAEQDGHEAGLTERSTDWQTRTCSGATVYTSYGADRQCPCIVAEETSKTLVCTCANRQVLPCIP